MTEPNLYEVVSDLRNLTRTVEDHYAETKSYRERQIAILEQLSAFVERQKAAESEHETLHAAVAKLTADVEALRERTWRLAVGAALGAGGLGAGAEKLLAQLFN